MNKLLTQIIKENGQRLVTLRPEDTVGTALQKLATNNLTCAPIMQFDPETNKRSLMGLIDTLDLLAYLYDTVNKPMKSPDRTKESNSITTDDVALLKKRSQDFKLSSVMQVSNFSGRNPVVTVPWGTSVNDAISMNLTEIHRICVHDEDGDVVGIVSQSDVIVYLASVIALGKLDLPQLGVPIHNIRHKSDKLELEIISEDKQAMEAFIMMHDRIVSSLAVVDYTGVLVGVISASDLRELWNSDLKMLLKPVSEFIQFVRNRQQLPPTYVVCVHPESTLQATITLLCREVVHRVFIADSQNKPVGVVSLTDVMKEIVGEPGAWFGFQPNSISTLQESLAPVESK